MSIFTTELRYPIEQYQHDHNLPPRTYDAGIYHLIGLDEYPIFEESYRSRLNNKIIEHYYFKEIGTDTLARFRWYMRTTLSELMPRFNALYEAQNSIVDPMTNRNLSWREVWQLAETGGTTTDKDGGTTYGRRDVTSTDGTNSYGRRDVVSTDGTNSYGRRDVVSTEGETNYGRTEHRANGGKDTQLAGTTKDKVIHSETPMNELQTNAVENGNYATDVTFTTHEGQRAGETAYGGTTDVTNGGSDTTTSERTSQASGADTTSSERTSQASGADTTSSDSTSQASGRDTTDSEERYTRALDTDGTKTHTDVGYDGTTPTALLAELADKFMNIDMLVIDSLAPLFMGLWE